MLRQFHKLFDTPMPYISAWNQASVHEGRELGHLHLQLQTQRDILRCAFDLGITHFDLANNYGPPHGSAETNFARHYR